MDDQQPDVAGQEIPMIVVDALVFAAEAHRMQRRKDSDATPYINHPIALLRILAVEGRVSDENVLAAALLHDYLEDCCGEKQERLQEGRSLLLQRFGEKVLTLVEALTDDKELPKEERKRLQVTKAREATREARLIKLADKIANLRDIAASPPHDWSIERQLEYFDWAATVVAGLRGTHPVLEALFDGAHAARDRIAGGRSNPDPA